MAESLTATAPADREIIPFMERTTALHEKMDEITSLKKEIVRAKQALASLKNKSQRITPPDEKKIIEDKIAKSEAELDTLESKYDTLVAAETAIMEEVYTAAAKAATVIIKTQVRK